MKPTADVLSVVPRVAMEHTFEVLDPSVRDVLQHEAVLLQLAVLGDHHLAAGVRAEGGHQPALQHVPDLVRHVEQSSLN